MPENLQLISRLQAIRRTVRRRLVAYGMFGVVAGGVVSSLTIIAVDWLLWLPAPLRLLVGCVYLVGFIGAIIHWIIKPLHAALHLGAIAVELESHFGELQDRLVSTVDFLSSTNHDSPELVQKVIANTTDIVADMPLESALVNKPVMRRAAMCVMSLLLLVVASVLAPNWIRVGYYRYVHPWGEIEWPRNVEIVSITGHQTVAIGESATVKMRVVRGLHATLRGIVRIKDLDGNVSTLALRRGLEETFSATIDTVTGDLRYWFEAGDDSTAKSPFEIRVAKRPEVLEALAVIEPPHYAGKTGVRTHDLADGPVRATIGSRVRLRIRASKAMSISATGGRSGLRGDDESFVVLSVAKEDDTLLIGNFPVTTDFRFRIELRDQNGFSNRGAADYEILAVPDTAPVVTILNPKSQVERTPRGSIDLVVRAEDDFGIEELSVEAERLGHTDRYSIALNANMLPKQSNAGVEAVALHSWEMTSLGLEPGDVLVYHARAVDNHPGETQGQIGKSPPLRVRIISEAEFDVRIRDDLALLESRIRQILLEESSVRDRTVSLRNQGTDIKGDRARRDTALRLTVRQLRVTRRIRDLAQRIRALSERIGSSAGATSIPVDGLNSVGESVEAVGRTSMASSSRALRAWAEREDKATEHGELDTAIESQATAIEQLRNILREIGRWGSFEGLLTSTRDLLDRQAQVREQTSRLARMMPGKPIDALTPGEKDLLHRAQRMQDQLALDVDQLLQRMVKLQGKLDATDPSGREAIEQALRAAAAHDLLKRVREAGNAIQDNRTSGAILEQKAAAEGLRNMIDALQERENRELRRLRKRLREAEQQIAELIEDQKDVRAATSEATKLESDQEQFSELRTQQRILWRNTKFLADELEEVERSAEAAPVVRRALEPMDSARVALLEERPLDAPPKQEEAIELLMDALDVLQALADQTEQELLQRTLAQIQADLEEMLVAQTAIHDGIEELQGAMSADGRITRAESRLASALARRQSDARGLVEAVMPDFEHVYVYRWAMGRVSGWMEECQQFLQTRQIGDELSQTSARIVRELEKLLQAIVDTLALQCNSEFAEAEGGGGGGTHGQQSASKPVPAVAELMVIKTMQVDINDRTKTLHADLDVSDLSEEQLREMRTIGEDQTQLRKLTELVTGRARQ